ncbi:MAG: fumarylacetoacetate hydrolase family protein [Firmicutes bacterium]|nr:fumarylacetoacetate hydrolase family protein [Bacillota bacterium]
MRWGRVQLENGEESAAVLVDDERVIALRAVNQRLGYRFPLDLDAIIRCGAVVDIAEALNDAARQRRLSEPLASFQVLSPLKAPERIVGIGLNYRQHAEDLGAALPSEPATFLKPLNTLIGPGDSIRLPAAAQLVTAEAELALVFGRSAKNVSPDEWRAVIFGAVPVLDMTAEDILKQNPRFLTRAKGFDTFFSSGPWIVTLDELPDLSTLIIRTIVNQQVRAEDAVGGMVYGIDQLVAWVTRGVSVGPTAVLSTGTPGAWPIQAGDQVTAAIDGLGRLTNPVVDDAGSEGG